MFVTTLKQSNRKLNDSGGCSDFLYDINKDRAYHENRSMDA